MQNQWIQRNKWIFVAGPLAFALFIGLSGEVVMRLWNWLLPAIFGLHPITLWQALGLLLLSRIFFGSWGGGGDNKSRRHKPESAERLTPEERESFRQKLRSGCEDFGASASEAGKPA